jgi:hypothetical protein
VCGKGPREKQNDESDVHLPQPQPQQKAVTYFLFLNRFVYRVFGRFVTRGLQKHKKLV